MRGLVFLLTIGAIAAAGWMLLRSMWQRSRAPAAAPLEDEPAALPPPASTSAKAPTSSEIFARLQELAFGVPSLEPPSSASHQAVAVAVGALLDTSSMDPRYAPRRPMLLPQLLRAVNDTEVSRREIAAIIARDPALAGNLLKLANSSFYRVSAQPVESIDRAVALLGTDGIRTLIAAALVQPVFRVASAEFARFPEVSWEHTYRTAAAAEAHAAIVENSDPFAAQLLGLVMGLSAIIVFRVALDQYAAQPLLPAHATVIASLLDAHTAKVAVRIASSWDLSGRILAALEDQIPDMPMHEPTSLGRSLQFGRLIGALALLHANNMVDDETARAVMLAQGTSEVDFERIWRRLTGNQPVVRRRP